MNKLQQQFQDIISDASDIAQQNLCTIKAMELCKKISMEYNLYVLTKYKEFSEGKIKREDLLNYEGYYHQFIDINYGENT